MSNYALSLLHLSVHKLVDFPSTSGLNHTMANQTSPNTTTGASLPSIDVFQDAQHAQDAWTAEIIDSPSMTINMWLDVLPPYPLRASIITAPTPPSSPTQVRAILINDGDNDDNASILHHPDPQQHSGIFVGVGMAPSTYTHLYGVMRELRTRQSSDETRSDLERDTVHGERKDDGLARADSAVGEEGDDVGQSQPDTEGVVRRFSFAETDEPVMAMAREETFAWRN
jgi:hypothetical protein